MSELANDDTLEWNAVTGTFADPAQSATLDAEGFAAKISERLNEAAIASHEQPGVIDILGNAAVYLHGADAFDRPPATLGSIADEWSSLGVSAQEADFMLDRSVAHYLSREQENDISVAYEQAAKHETLDRKDEREHEDDEMEL